MSAESLWVASSLAEEYFIDRTFTFMRYLELEKKVPFYGLEHAMLVQTLIAESHLAIHDCFESFELDEAIEPVKFNSLNNSRHPLRSTHL